MQNDKPLIPGKPQELPEMDMHGPYEVSIKILMVMPNGERGSLTFYGEPGRLLTRADQLAIVNALQDPAQLVAAGAPAGTRLLRKPEFVEYTTKRATGMAIPMPGNQEYVPAGCEIPHGMLVHAIMGAQVTEALAAEYAARQLLTIEAAPSDSELGALQWNADLLDSLPDAMLLAMYQRITAPAPEGAA